jgi:hypothetical protein
MATFAVLNIEFRGICCFVRQDKKTTLAVLPTLEAPDGLEYVDKDDKPQKTKKIPKHIAYVGVRADEQKRLDSKDLGAPKKLGKHGLVFGYTMDGAAQIIHKPLSSSGAHNQDDTPGVTKKLFDATTFVLNDADLPKLGATMELPVDLITDKRDEFGAIQSLLSVIVESTDDLIQLQLIIQSTTYNVTLKPPATLIIGNEMDDYLGGGGGTDFHHFVGYTLFAKEPKKVKVLMEIKKIKRADFRRTLKLARAAFTGDPVLATTDEDEAAGLGCSNSQYP